MPLVSAELRWFLAEGCKREIDQLDRWFRGGRLLPGGGKKPRTDIYALDESTDELGIKGREGKEGLEIKTLVDGSFAEFEFANRTSTAQLWSKVTSRSLLLPPGPTQRCETRKTRWLRTFDTSLAVPREVELGAGNFGEDPLHAAAPDVGCNVEWTLLELPDPPETWWTFGLEAFAVGQTTLDLGRLKDALEKTMVGLVHALGPLPQQSDAWQELSYPAWLNYRRFERGSNDH